MQGWTRLGTENGPGPTIQGKSASPDYGARCGIKYPCAAAILAA